MSESTSRRALLTRAGLAAGIAGAGAVGLKTVAGAAASPPERSLQHIVHGRDWRIVFHGAAHGTVPAPTRPGCRRAPWSMATAAGSGPGVVAAAIHRRITHLHRIDLGDGA